METLKKLKKHDHTLTDIIKAFIFGLVLLAPCFAILTKCLYVINNKNANQSYSQYEQSVYTQITSSTQLENGKTYYITDKPNSIGGLYVFYETSYKNLPNGCNAFRFYTPNNNRGLIYFFNYDLENNVATQISNTDYNGINLTLKLNKFVSYNGNIELGAYVNTLIQEKGTLDNVFYYAVNEMKDSELFGWTKETGIYTAVNGMCSGLAVQDGALPVLITYWTLMTAIYIILDIVIFVFKKITHFMQ